MGEPTRDLAVELHGQAQEMTPQHAAATRADFVIRMGLRAYTDSDGMPFDVEVQSAALPTTNRPAEEWESIRVIDAKGQHHIFRRERYPVALERCCTEHDSQAPPCCPECPKAS